MFTGNNTINNKSQLPSILFGRSYELFSWRLPADVPWWERVWNVQSFPHVASVQPVQLSRAVDAGRDFTHRRRGRHSI